MAIIIPVHTTYVHGTQHPLLSYNRANTSRTPFPSPSIPAFQWNMPNPGPASPSLVQSSAQTPSMLGSIIGTPIAPSAPPSTPYHSHPMPTPPLSSTLLRECFPLPHHAQLRDSLSRVVQIIDENNDIPPDDLLQFTRREDQSTFQCLFWNGGINPCKKSFNRKDRAIDHVWSHLGYRPYACRGGCGIIDWFVPP